MASKRTRTRKRQSKTAKHFKIGSPTNGNNSQLVLSYKVKGGIVEYKYSQDSKNTRNTRAMWSEQTGLDYIQKLFAGTVQNSELEFASIWRTEPNELVYQWNAHIGQWQTPPQYAAFTEEQKEKERLVFVQQKQLERKNAQYRLWLPLKPEWQIEQKAKFGNPNIVEWCNDFDFVDGKPFAQFRDLIEKNQIKASGIAARVYDNQNGKFVARIDINTGNVKFL